MGEAIVVETDMFQRREVKPEFINPCCFGEDFAVWLKRELTRAATGRLKLSEIHQEDYGWGFWVFDGRDRLWVAVSYVGNGPQESTPQWVISVKRDPGLNVIRWFRSSTEAVELLHGRIESALELNSAFRILK